MRTAESIKFFTNEERDRIFKVLDREVKNASTIAKQKSTLRNRALFEIMYYCGLRVSEVCALELDWFNQEKNTLYCYRLKSGNANTIRIVDDKILYDLEKHLRVNKPVKYIFESPLATEPMSRKTIFKITRKVCQLAMIDCEEKCHSHTFRHTRAIDLLESGKSVYDIQYWLGHVNIANTEIYLRFTTRMHEELFESMKTPGYRRKYDQQKRKIVF